MKDPRSKDDRRVVMIYLNKQTRELEKDVSEQLWCTPETNLIDRDSLRGNLPTAYIYQLGLIEFDKLLRAEILERINK